MAKCRITNIEGTRQQVHIPFAGVFDKKRRQVGVVVTRTDCILALTPDATSWRESDLQPGPVFFYSVMSSRNGETFGSSSAHGCVATTAERDAAITKAIAASHKRQQKQFGSPKIGPSFQCPARTPPTVSRRRGLRTTSPRANRWNARHGSKLALSPGC